MEQAKKAVEAVVDPGMGTLNERAQLQQKCPGMDNGVLLSVLEWNQTVSSYACPLT